MRMKREMRRRGLRVGDRDRARGVGGCGEEMGERGSLRVRGVVGRIGWGARRVFLRACCCWGGAGGAGGWGGEVAVWRAS